MRTDLTPELEAEGTGKLLAYATPSFFADAEQHTAPEDDLISRCALGFAE
ncbi:MAG: hypothetical protein QF554_01645 [Dehalococcoidia bacterium]|nr:hypothetical protein [Dehalococcoidia bacterium]